MIQRIQSVYLLIALVLQVLIFVLPVWKISNPLLEMIAQVQVSASSGLGALNMVIMFGIFLCVFFYRRRLLQYRIARMLMIIVIIFFAYLIYTIEDSKVFHNAAESGFSGYQPAAFLPLVSAFFI